MLASLSSHPSKDTLLPQALESHLESKAGGNILLFLSIIIQCVSRLLGSAELNGPTLLLNLNSGHSLTPIEDTKFLRGGGGEWWWLRMIRFIRFPFPLTQTQPSLPQASRQNPSLSQLRPESPTRTNKGFIRPPPLSFDFEPSV